GDDTTSGVPALAAGGGRVLIRRNAEPPAPRVHDRDRADPVIVIPPEESLREAAFTPDAATLATVGDAGPVKLRDLKSGKPVREFPAAGRPSGLSPLAVSGGGKYLHYSAVVANEPPTLAIYSIDDGAIWCRVRFTGAVAVSPDGRSALAGVTDGFRLYDL